MTWIISSISKTFCERGVGYVVKESTLFLKAEVKKNLKDFLYQLLKAKIFWVKSSR